MADEHQLEWMPSAKVTTTIMERNISTNEFINGSGQL